MTVEYYPERDDLYWHALNYRCAAGQHAEQMWQELVACHERLVAAAVAKHVPRLAPMAESLPPLKKLEVEHAEWRLRHGRLLVHCVFGAGPEPRWARPMWDEVLLSGPIVESPLDDAIRASLAGMCREASRDHLKLKDEAEETALLGRALAKLKLATDDEQVHSL